MQPQVMQLQEETDKTPQFLISFKLGILCSRTCQSSPPRAGEIKTPPSIRGRSNPGVKAAICFRANIKNYLLTFCVVTEGDGTLGVDSQQTRCIGRLPRLWAGGSF